VDLVQPFGARGHWILELVYGSFYVRDDEQVVLRVGWNWLAGPDYEQSAVGVAPFAFVICDGIAAAASSVMPAQSCAGNSGSRGESAKFFLFVQGGVDFSADRAFTNGTELTPFVVHAVSLALFSNTSSKLQRRPHSARRDFGTGFSETLPGISCP